MCDDALSARLWGRVSVNDCGTKSGRGLLLTDLTPAGKCVFASPFALPRSDSATRSRVPVPTVRLLAFRGDLGSGREVSRPTRRFPFRALPRQGRQDALRTSRQRHSVLVAVAGTRVSAFSSGGSRRLESRAKAQAMYACASFAVNSPRMICRPCRCQSLDAEPRRSRCAYRKEPRADLWEQFEEARPVDRVQDRVAEPLEPPVRADLILVREADRGPASRRGTSWSCEPDERGFRLGSTAAAEASSTQARNEPEPTSRKQGVVLVDVG